MNNKQIVVTGGAGYIGAVVVRQLLNRGYKVKVIDLLRFGGESLLEVFNSPQFTFYKEDVRNKAAMEKILKDSYGIIHLAAIVGDPACKEEPELAKSTNLEGTKQLYDIANKVGCKRFIFASTCSNYGKMADPEKFLTEEAKLAPVSLYAETKVAAETYLLSQSKSNQCLPTCLRFSTVYGVAPRIRFDLTVNEFAKELKLGKKLVVFGEQFWRPYCHVTDLSRAVISVLESVSSKVAFEVFNVGDTSENYTKQMIIDEIKKQIPSCTVEYVKKESDPRDYRINFDKIKQKLGFTITKRVRDGISEITELLDTGLLLNPDDKKYSNV